MISADSFLREAATHGFDFYTGVPCSFLTPMINGVISDHETRYVGAASEGEAVAIAARSAPNSSAQQYCQALLRWLMVAEKRPVGMGKAAASRCNSSKAALQACRFSSFSDVCLPSSRAANTTVSKVWESDVVASFMVLVSPRVVAGRSLSVSTTRADKADTPRARASRRL